MSEVAQLMPNGEQTFVDANGVPLAGGSVTMYIPSTTTFKNTWQDSGETILNSNPITLDAAGRCIIYGNGQYRQIVKDRLANLQWDQLTNWVTPPAAVSSFYDLAVYVQGKPSNSETYPIFNVPRNLTLPSGLVGTKATIAVNPTGSLVCTLLKNGSSTIGTITFSTGGVPTISFLADVVFNAGDQFQINFPSSADATGASMSFTFVFTVN